MKTFHFLLFFLISLITVAQKAPVISAAQLSATTIKIDWTHDGQLADEFIVYSNGVEKAKLKTTQKTFTFDKLNPNTSYKVKVSNSYKTKLYTSDEPTLITFNSTPTNFSSPSQDFRAISLSWEHPDAAKVNFGVSYTTNPDYISGTQSKIVQKQKNVTIDGLDPKTKYYFTVYIIPTVGVTQMSDLAKTIASTLDPTPARPSITDIKPNTSSAIISWSPINGATKYLVEVDTQNDFRSDKKLIYNNKETSQNFSPLIQNTPYFCRVLAYLEPYTNFPSQWSETKEFRTLDSPPTTPTLNNPTASADGKSITLSWKTNSNNSEIIEIAWGENEKFDKPALVAKAADGSIKITSNVEQCKTYLFKILAKNSSNQKSQYTGTQTVKTDIAAPNPVKGFAIKEASSDKLVITWNAPDNSQVDSYQFLYADNKEFNNPKEVPNSNRTATIPSLQASKEYYFKINAHNCKGTTNSEIYNAKTSPPPAPPVPTNLRVSNVSFCYSISLAWDNAVTDASKTIIERRKGADAFIEVASFAGNILTWTDNNVTGPKTDFTYRVKIEKNNVSSGFSNEVTATTTGPIAPSNVLATQKGFDATGKPIIEITWKRNYGYTDIVYRSLQKDSGYEKIYGNDGDESYTDLTTICGKFYYYKVAVHALCGLSETNDVPASVSVACQEVIPAAPANLKATVKSTSQIDLIWDNVSGETGFELERSTNGTTFTNIKNLATDELTFSNTGLSASTKYYYRVRAKNSAGNSAYSNIAEATTQAPPVVAPASPANLKATVKSSSEIDLSWDNVAGETGFELERSTNGTSFTNIKNLVTDELTFSNTGLSASTKYYYRVRAKNSAGNSGYSNIAEATTQAPPVVAPAAPANLKATVKSTSQIDLSWDNVAGETGFELERSTNGTTFTNIKNLATDELTFSNTGLSASTKYYYRVRAKNSAGNSGYSNIAEATTQAPPVVAPAAPANLKATVKSTSQIDLSWDNVAGETGFELERSTNGTTFTNIKNLATDELTFSNTGLSASTKYYYRVRAKNSAGNSAYSNIAEATTQAPPVVAPAAPANLKATVKSTSQIDLSWDNVAGETGFELERSTNGTTFTNIKNLATDELTFSNTGLSAFTKYYYRVRAKNSAGNSGYSNIAEATTQAPPVVAPAAPANLKATVKSTSQIDLSWDNVAGETGFELERSTNGTTFTNIKNLATGELTFSNTGLSASTKYYYRVRAKNSAGNSGYSNIAEATTQAPPVVAPAAPANLKATVKSTSQIDLSWDNVAGETGFELERSTNGTTFTNIKNLATDELTFSNTGLSASTKYYYRVRAKNSAGNGAYSNVVNVTTLSSSPGLIAPKNLRQDLSNLNINQISLIWDNSATDIIKMEIWKKVNSDTTWILLDSLTEKPLENKFRDRKVRTGNRYQYKVRNQNTKLQYSAFSNTVEIIAPIVNSIGYEDKNVKIFPNPFHESISISTEHLGENIIIQDTQGKVIFRKDKMNNREDIDLMLVPNGVYFITIQKESVKENFKIIKQ